MLVGSSRVLPRGAFDSRAGAILALRAGKDARGRAPESAHEQEVKVLPGAGMLRPFSRT
jgi:hypothetical protein